MSDIRTLSLTFEVGQSFSLTFEPDSFGYPPKQLIGGSPLPREVGRVPERCCELRILERRCHRGPVHNASSTGGRPSHVGVIGGIAEVGSRNTIGRRGAARW